MHHCMKCLKTNQGASKCRSEWQTTTAGAVSSLDTEQLSQPSAVGACDNFSEFDGASDMQVECSALPDLADASPSDEQFKNVGMVWEIFSGTCRLSKACRRLGLQAFSVDKDPSRAEHAPVASFDITNAADLEALVSDARALGASLVHAHFAPSCGTASKARERKIQGVPNAPRPLRSEDEPDGFTDLSIQERQRVQQANDSYSAMATLIVLLVQMQVSVSVEDPVNSIFWLTSFVQKLFQKIGAGHVTILQHCMHGGDRDKTSKFWSFNPRKPTENLLQSLALTCLPRQHTHKSWQPYKLQGKLIFPTKEEAAYPVLISERLASLFLQETK